MKLKHIRLKNRYVLLLVGFMLISTSLFAQDKSPINVEELSLEQIKGLTQEDLLELPFEDLIHLVKKFKLSSIEELYALLLNPTQSTASKMEEDVFESPLATTVITADELEKSGARSIPEALKLAPGVIVREKTNGNYDVHLRGNDYIPPGSDLTNSVNSTTLVMIDNRPVYNSFVGATFWENLPVSVNDLEKIEIIYGPSAALYGPNAVSGVIHLITKKADTEGLQTNFDIQAGTNSSKIATGSINYNKGKWGIRLSGNYNQSNRFQDNYYIPQNDEYVSGDQVGELNASIDTSFIASEFSNDYSNAIEQGAANLDITYTPSDKVMINYQGSYQSSSAQTAYMDIGSVLSTRKSTSFSNSINVKAGGFDSHISLLSGQLNAVEGMPGYEYDYQELNAKAGYNFKYKNLIIRPGIMANYANYSDENYVDIEANTGLLNGSAELGTVQGSLRLDYTAFDKLRIVGAWLQGYFYQPERNYSSYQFASSYQVNDNTLLRAVVSKSNSSPFVLNTYMDKSIQVPMPTNPNNDEEGYMNLNMVGNEDLAPQEMQMFELGLRKRILKNLQADVSIFYNKSKDYAQLVTDETTLPSGPPEDLAEGEVPSEPMNDITILETMENLDLKSDQIGITANFKYVMNKKLNMSLFATYQHTELKDFEISDPSQYEELTGTSLDDNTLTENSEYLSFEHSYTPNVYGGASINYSPTNKWNFNTSLYGYSKQESFYTKGRDFINVTIDPKLTFNLKASYQINTWMNVYVNARNLTNNTKQEFMFTDKTGGVYLGGISIKL
ncbi:TonB-dependent receptor plug domain-containing protein [Labilibacter marinus]|uniref:TonB-dependent receptor plug domain-containing protein n=1 Tax=Labilibacter marinus TaxID=1477105 RepID=UPI00094F795C|nr:TonB-dependent receptor plug domain-containing protein [Labilibacter marinus]